MAALMVVVAACGSGTEDSTEEAPVENTEEGNGEEAAELRRKCCH